MIDKYLACHARNIVDRLIRSLTTQDTYTHPYTHKTQHSPVAELVRSGVELGHADDQVFRRVNSKQVCS